MRPMAEAFIENATTDFGIRELANAQSVVFTEGKVVAEQFAAETLYQRFGRLGAVLRPFKKTFCRRILELPA